MKRLPTLKNSAKLRQKTLLQLVLKNVTRWSSVYNIVQPYTEIKRFLDPRDNDIADFVLSARQNLFQFLKKLTDSHSVTLKLQEEDLRWLKSAYFLTPLL